MPIPENFKPTSMRTVLSGDIGGTSTRLQLTQFAGDHNYTILAQEKYQSDSASTLLHLIETFLSSYQIDVTALYSACFAVAGPIVEGKVKFTNLPWQVSDQALKALLQTSRVKLINDFQAIGYGIETLKPEQITCLQKGQSKPGAPMALVGAGTGLGVGILYRDGNSYDVTPTEGGHVDFAPTTDTQIALLNYLRRKYHRVSVERLVSGQGLENIYRFVRDNPVYGETENEALHYAVHTSHDIAAAISHFATEKQDPMAMRALEIFIDIYGATAGNLALTTLPFGGLYVVGGIAPKLLPQIRQGRFLEHFCDKGRMSTLLTTIPVNVVLDTNIGLQGAANFAAKGL